MHTLVGNSMRSVVDAQAQRKLRDIQRVPGVERATRRALLYFVVPLWLGSGLADWWHHRRTHIERTAGAYESLLHLLMLAEAGVPSMLGLFLEVNAGVLATAYAALAAHEVTAFWDVAYAETRRRVTPTEQHVRSYLEVGSPDPSCWAATSPASRRRGRS